MISRGYRVVNLFICLNGQSHVATHLGVLKNLCSDVILSQDFLHQHQKITFKYSRPLPKITVDNNTHQFCTLNTAEMEEPSLFPNILPSHKPTTAAKSGYFDKVGQSFINKEIQKLLSKGIIEESVSPCQAQLVVVEDPTNCKKKKECA